jgi:hypothetical protein
MEPPGAGLRFGKRLRADRGLSRYFLDFPGLLDTASGEGHLLGGAWIKENLRRFPGRVQARRPASGPASDRLNLALRCNADKRVAEEGHNNKESAP